MSANELRIIRTFEAARERVFDAFTQRDALQSWFGPEGITAPAVAIDARPGGKYRYEMHSEAGGIHVVTGEFREVKRPERLVFTWGWLEGDSRGVETLITLTFAERGGRTELTIVHSGFPDEAQRAAHDHGWTSSMDCLAAMLAGRAKSPVARPTVLGDPRSSYVRSVRMALVEKGIAYSHEPHAPHTPAVDAIHPWGKVPGLRHCDIALFESSAIMRYVDEAFPGPKLMPDTPADRARAEQWISAVNCYLYDAMVKRYVLQYIFPRGADGKPDRTVIDGAIGDAQKQFAIIERAYGERDFLIGERPSLADLLLAPIVFYVGRMPEGNDLLARHPAVRRAHAAMARRESFKLTAPPAG